MYNVYPEPTNLLFQHNDGWSQYIDKWVLGLKQDSRIFHFLSVPDIVNQVLDEHRIPYQSQLQQTYPPREYVTQKRESDLDFILRLMAEVGITFWFEDNELVYGDSHLA